MTFYLPESKREKVKKLVAKTIHNNNITVRKLSEVVGYFVSVCPAVPYSMKGLEIFAKNKTKQNILLRIDSEVAISYINKFGGCHSLVLHNIAKKIWQWCEKREIFIFGSYIKSSENSIADFASRVESDQSEWKLCSLDFDAICEKFGTPSIDLFASQSTKQCSRYYSFHPDSGSEAIDAFTMIWDDELCYAFPPFCLIHKVLRKIVEDGCKCILIVPFWECQAWYPEFRAMCQSELLVMSPRIDLLKSPYVSSPHPLHKTLKLVAAVVSRI